MTLKELPKYIEGLMPIEKIPLTWDSMGYTSDSFNKWVSEQSFTGWEGDLPTEEEVAVIVKLLEVKPEDSLLDIACGYGRHDLLFAGRYGLKVT